MRLPTAFSLDITKFPLTLAGGLRMQFADVACAPIPQGLAALLRRLTDDGAEHSGSGEMGQVQRKRRAVLLVEDDAELRGLTAMLLDEESSTRSNVKVPKRHSQQC